MGIPPLSTNWWFLSTFLPIRSLWEAFHSKMAPSIQFLQITPKPMRQNSSDSTVTQMLQLSTHKASYFSIIHVPKLKTLRLIPFLVASSSLLKMRRWTRPWIIWIDKTPATLNSLCCKKTIPLQTANHIWLASQAPQTQSPKATSCRLSTSTETSLQISLFCLPSSKLPFSWAQPLQVNTRATIDRFRWKTKGIKCPIVQDKEQNWATQTKTGWACLHLGHLPFQMECRHQSTITVDQLRSITVFLLTKTQVRFRSMKWEESLLNAWEPVKTSNWTQSGTQMSPRIAGPRLICPGQCHQVSKTIPICSEEVEQLCLKTSLWVWRPPSSWATT